MKVVISADMEGTCGVVSWTQVTPPEYDEPNSSQTEYERARARMTREVNAAVEGALEAGAEEVIVNDSHDGMRNLLPEELNPNVRWVSGNDKPLGMVQGVDLDGVRALFYTGYHAKAGTPNAPLAHTWTGWVNDVRVNGLSTGEFGINALVAGHFGVPVTLVTGDIKAVQQTQALLGDQVAGAIVKEGLSTFSALHLHPVKAQQLIREAAAQAVRNAKSAKPYRLPDNALVEIEFEHQTRADHASNIPGVERVGERVIGYRPANGRELTFRAVIRAASVKMTP